MGGEGGAWGSSTQVRGSGAAPPGLRVGAGAAGARFPARIQARVYGPLTSHEHVGAGGCSALYAGLDVLVVAAVAARVVGAGLAQQQHLAVGPGVRALAVLHNSCVLAVLLPCGRCLLSPWPGPLEGVLPPGRGHESTRGAPAAAPGHKPCP